MNSKSAAITGAFSWSCVSFFPILDSSFFVFSSSIDHLINARFGSAQSGSHWTLGYSHSFIVGQNTRNQFGFSHFLTKIFKIFKHFSKLTLKKQWSYSLARFYIAWLHWYSTHGLFDRFLMEVRDDSILLPSIFGQGSSDHSVSHFLL